MRKFATVSFLLSFVLLSHQSATVERASAQTWTGNVNGNWNNAGNWSSTIPVSGSSTLLTFGATSNASMNNDIPGTFMLNRMTFNSSAPAYSLSGSQLDFRTSSTTPTIVMNSSNGVTITTPLSLTGSLGISGNGNVALNGLITGAQGITYASDSGTLTLGNNANSFTGPLVIGAAVGTGTSATLSVSTIANGGVNSPLGAASNAPTNLVLQGRATLLLTGTDPAYSTDRGMRLVSSDSSNGTGINVQNAGTTLTWNGPITNSSLFKRGAGTLILTNPTSDYENMTVEAGTVFVGSAGASPNSITVQTGALFDTNGFGNPGRTPLITVSGGTFRHASSANSLNTFGLASSLAGGTFDLTGSSNVGFNVGFLSFKGNTAINGPGSNYINNSSVGMLAFNIDPGKTVTSGLSLAALASPATHPFKLAGGGTLYLTNPAAYQSLITVNQGTLRMDSLANVGPGGFEVTIDGGLYKYSGSTNSAGGLAVGLNGGTLEVTSAATTMTLTGPITGTAGATFTKTGAGTLALTTGASTIGDFAIASGTVQTASDSALGTGAITFSPLTTLRYTATTTSSRTFNLGLNSLIVDSGATLTLNNAVVSGGILRGGGTFALTGGTQMYNTTTLTSSVLNQTGSAAVSNLTNNGTYTVAPGQSLNWNIGTNTSAGRFTVGGTADVSDFVSDGQINVPNGGTLNNSGAPLVLGGGSRTLIGSVASPGGTLNLGGQTLELNGGLLVNNGTVNGTVNVNFGSLAKGAGTYGVVNVNTGGVYSPGNSPGISNAAAVRFDTTAVTSGAPALAMEIAGLTPGTQYDQLHVTGQLAFGGTLQVSLLDGFTPAAGDSFDLLDWNTSTGSFGSLALPSLDAGLRWDISNLYTTGVLSIASGPLLGDYNQNGVVESGDYVFLRKNAAPPTDFATWRSHFGQSLPASGSGSSLGAGAAVPEPATLWMLLAGIAGLYSRRTRAAT